MSLIKFCFRSGSELKTLDCTWMDGICGWKQGASNDVDWKQTLAFIYMYTPGGIQNKAMLVSPKVPANTEFCVNFWYSIYGSDDEILSVYIQTGGLLKSKLWSRRGIYDHTQWFEVNITVPAQAQASSLVLEGVLSNKTYIRLRKFSATSGPCTVTGVWKVPSYH